MRIEKKQHLLIEVSRCISFVLKGTPLWSKRMYRLSNQFSLTIKELKKAAFFGF
jgi:hypothetical protein